MSQLFFEPVPCRGLHAGAGSSGTWGRGNARMERGRCPSSFPTSCGTLTLARVIKCRHPALLQQLSQLRSV